MKIPGVAKFGAFILLWVVLGSELRAWAVITNSFNRPFLAAGAGHALMIKSDGTVWGIGDNYFGQLEDKPATFGKGSLLAWDFTDAYRLPGILGASAVAAGSYHSMVLKWNGTILAFGANSKGQLGLGNMNDIHSATLIPNLSSVFAVEAGHEFSVAVLSNGCVKAWGNNSSGQLGTGSTTPAQINSPTNVFGLSNIVAIACGYRHALAISNDVVWAWGANASGQLGAGTTQPSYVPVKVSTLSGVIGVAAGEDFSMALKTNGTVYVWGESSNGRLGLGSGVSDQYLPTQLLALSNICQIRAGSRQGYALDTNGHLWVWGYNGYSSLLGATYGLGVPSPATLLSPIQHTNIPNALCIGSTGPKAFYSDSYPRHFSTAFYEDGKIRDWGAYNNGGHYGLNSYVGDNNGNPKIISTAIDWGYSATLTSGAVHPNAYCRGDKSVADLASFVLPIDFQNGQPLSNVGGIVTDLLPMCTNFAVGYHYDGTNSSAGGQADLALRIAYQNPIVAFGSRAAGSPMYTQRSYRFIVFAGRPAMINDYPFLDDYSTALKIDVYSKTNYGFVATTNIPIPYYLLTNANWGGFLTNGLKTFLTAFGLTTTLSTREYPYAYGVTNYGVVELTHEATDLATNYVFVVKLKGHNGKGWMSLSQDFNPIWEPLYTMEFDPAWPWNIRFLSQIQFNGEPLPPFYDGKSEEDGLASIRWTGGECMRHRIWF